MNLTVSRRLALRASLLPLLASGLTACISFGSKQVQLQVNASAADDLNPSASGRPSPLTVRMYELSADASFNRADFLSVYQNESATLGGDLVAREEFVLQPGETRKLQKPLNEKTRFVAVFGVYRSFERAVWRVIVPVSGPSMQLKLGAAANALSLQKTN